MNPGSWCSKETQTAGECDVSVVDETGTTVTGVDPDWIPPVSERLTGMLDADQGAAPETADGPARSRRARVACHGAPRARDGGERHGASLLEMLRAIGRRRLAERAVEFRVGGAARAEASRAGAAGIDAADHRCIR